MNLRTTDVKVLYRSDNHKMAVCRCSAAFSFPRHAGGGHWSTASLWKGFGRPRRVDQCIKCGSGTEEDFLGAQEEGSQLQDHLRVATQVKAPVGRDEGSPCHHGWPRQQESVLSGCQGGEGACMSLQLQHLALRQHVEVPQPGNQLVEEGVRCWSR